MALKNEKYLKIDDNHIEYSGDQPVKKTYNRAGVLSLKAQLEAELVRVDAIIAKMDQLGIS